MTSRKKARDYWAKRFFSNGFEAFRAGRWYFLVAAVLFILSGVGAFLFPENFRFFDPFLRGIVNQIDGMNGYEITWFIFSNNVTAAFSSFISGIVFGILPLFNIVFNGLVLGYVISLAHGADTSLADIFLNLVPHGIFELPAICFAVGLGARVGIGFVKEYFSFHKKSKRMKTIGWAVVAFGAVFSVIISAVILSNYEMISNSNTSLSGAVAVSEIAVLIPLAFLFLFSSRKLFIAQVRGFKRRFMGGIKAFFAIIVPLLVLAAIIESFLIVLGA